MARSTNLSEGMRDFAEQGAEQAGRMTDMGVFGMRDFAEHNVGQARHAFEGVLSAAQRTMTTFDQQASEIRQKTLSPAAKSIANSFEFSQRLLGAQSAEEVVQLQADFAEAQMHAWADQTRELGQTVASTATSGRHRTVRLPAPCSLLPNSASTRNTLHHASHNVTPRAPARSAHCTSTAASVSELPSPSQGNRMSP